MKKEYKIEYHTQHIKMVLCSDIIWKAKKSNNGDVFTESEIEHLMNNWKRNGVFNIDKIKIIEV